MKLTSLFMNTLSSNNEQLESSKSMSKGTEYFDSFMQKANKADKAQSYRENTLSRKKEDSSINERQLDKKKADSSVSRVYKKSDNDSSKANASNDTKPADKTRSTEAVQEVSKADSTAQESEKINNEIIKNLRDILGIPEEQITEILNALNLTALDLLKSDSLNQFLQMALGAETAVDLLSVPNIKQIYSDIKNLEQMYQNIKGISLDEEKSGNMQQLESNTLQASDDTEEFLDSHKLIQADDNSGEAVSENTKLLENNTNTNAALMETTDEMSGNAQQHPGSNFLNYNKNSDENLAFSNEAANPAVGEVKESISYNQNMLKAQSTSNINPRDVINQLMNKMKIEYKGDTTEIKMTLKPENLGEVTLKVITENGIITAQFVAENQRVKEIIESQFNQLKNALQQQGVEVSSLEVSVGQNQQDQRMNEFLHEQKKSSHRIQSIINGIGDEEEEILQPQIMPDSSVEYTA